MKYVVNKKEIEIPDEEIEKLMNTLDLTREEAINTWLCDNDYEVNEEEEELTKKAKENRITATIHEAKVEKERKPRAKTVKEYPDKEEIINVLFGAVAAMNDVNNLKITNKAKVIEFTYKDNEYKIDLIQRRKAKGE